jgi:ATP-dependent Clp protease protease subunit
MEQQEAQTARSLPLRDHAEQWVFSLRRSDGGGRLLLLPLAGIAWLVVQRGDRRVRRQDHDRTGGETSPTLRRRPRVENTSPPAQETQMTLVMPMVTWQDAREEWVVDIYSRLLQDRIIFLGTPIDEQIANLVVAELLHLESEQSDRDIAMYVNSPGGSVYAGLTIYDTMQFVRPDVQTMCVGIAMGMGALIVLGGTRGKRVALPHAKILLNQVSGGFEGEVSDIEIQAREVLALGRRLEEIIAEHTGQPLAKVASDLERDYYMSSEEALAYGVIDRVISHR